MKTKYIVIKAGTHENELIFTFPAEVNHKHFFSAVKMTEEGSDKAPRWPYCNAKCIGAGFVMDGQCFGKSESLGVLSRHALDTALLDIAMPKPVGVFLGSGGAK